MDLELAQLIEGLRRELTSAAQVGEDQDVRFDVENVEIEVEVHAATETTGEGGLKFWVVNVGARHDRTAGSTARVKLNLKVEGPAGRRLKVSSGRSR